MNKDFSQADFYGEYNVYESDVKAFYPERARNTHKGTYGSACIVAGSVRYIGAAALSAEAALKSGCGYVKLTCSEYVKLALAAKYPQVIFLDEPDLNSQAIAIGMGCGVNKELYILTERLLSEYTGTLIIDADGLNSIAEYGLALLETERKCRVLLTPHVKEFSRLAGIEVNEILKRPIEYSRNFANDYGITLLLKGADSIITDGKRTKINTRGSTALAKGGSGDMLSGYICGTSARGLEPFESALCSAYTLGVSAEISSKAKTDYCVTAKDILKNIHKAVKLLTK